MRNQDRQWGRSVGALIVFLGAMVGPTLLWTGCEREGPAERAGERIDNAAKDAGRAVERAGEDLQDAARDARR